jgi:hypothetical protein
LDSLFVSDLVSVFVSVLLSDELPELCDEEDDGHSSPHFKQLDVLRL